jgi:hypothetical protein
MHYLRSRKLPKAGTGRSNARNTLSVIKSIPGLKSRNRESVQKRASSNMACSFDFRHDTQGYISVSWLRNSLRETSGIAVFLFHTLFSLNPLNGPIRKSPSPPLKKSEAR